MRTYGRIVLEEDPYARGKDVKPKWAIHELEPHVCIKLKNTFAQIDKTSVSPFRFINDPEMCGDLLWFMTRYPLEISEKDLGRLKRGRKKFENKIDEIEHYFDPNYKPVALDFKDGQKARDYQATGKDIYMAAKRTCCADDIGLGKTVLSICSFTEKKCLPALVTVQTHLTKQWKAEIEKFLDVTVHIIKTRKPYKLPPAEVYISKYGSLSGWVDVFAKGMFKSVVFDEVQELRREESQKYQAAKIVADRARYVLGLSATPIYNYGDEIFNIMQVIDPNVLGNRYDFMREWVMDKTVTDPKALGAYLREKHALFKRTRADVGRELPPVNTIIHTVPIDYKEVENSRSLAKMLAQQTLNGSFVERGRAARDLSIMLRQSTGIAKAKGVADYVRILLENGEPVLLAGWHRDVYDIWLKELEGFNPLMYTGTESEAQKRKTKEGFINGDSNLMIISLRSGVGLDGLQNSRCKYVLIGELDWSPEVHNQIIGRVDRDGQENEVTAIFLTVDYGSDPSIVDICGLKASQSHGIVNPLLAPAQQYSDGARLKKLAEDYLSSLSS